MYETFYELRRRPFLAVPDIEAFFRLPQCEDSLHGIERAVRRAEGLSLIFGASGTGKTLLLRLLKKQLESQFTVCLLANGQLETVRAFLQQLLFELRLPFHSEDSVTLRLQLLEYARKMLPQNATRGEGTQGIVLLIDEAQFLDMSVLEEIRLLLNCDDGKTPYFRVVLAGTAELEEKLIHPRLEAFNQRIVSRRYLENWSRDETAQYIQWQTQTAMPDAAEKTITSFANDMRPFAGTRIRIDGSHEVSAPSLFSEAAKREIHRLSDGLPRLINQLCDGVLQLAAQQKMPSVDVPLVLAAWAKLQQIGEEVLPFPRTLMQSARSAPHSVTTQEPLEPVESIEQIVARKKASFHPKLFSSIVEFGSLEQHTKEDAAPALVAPTNYKPAYPGEEDEATVIEIAQRKSAELQPAETPNSDTTGEIGEFDDSLFAAMRARKPTFHRRERKHFRCSDHGDTSCFLQRIGTRHIMACLDTKKPETEMRQQEEKLVWEFEQAPLLLEFVPTTESIKREADGREAKELEISGGDEMDQETLKRYGQEVLDHVEPFVRKEPVHAYQTSDFNPVAEYLIDYPDDRGQVIQLNWFGPDCTGLAGTAISYSDYFDNNAFNNHASDYHCMEHREEQSTGLPKPPFAEKRNAAKLSDVTKISLSRDPVHENSVWNKAVPNVTKTSLEEHFSEIEGIRTEPISLEMVFRTNAHRHQTKASAEAHSEAQDAPTQANFATNLVEGREEICTEKMAFPLQSQQWQQQVESVLKRLHDAAEKIEQAADVSMAAGQQVKQAAEFVETEVHAALPNYLEMFQQLSDFQQNLSSELLNLSTPLIVPMTASAEKLATENRAMQQDVPERKTLAFQQLVRQPSTWQPSVRVQPLRFCNPYVAGGTSQAPFEKEGDEPAGRKETLSIDLKTLFQ